jgi:hypothetical protein
MEREYFSPEISLTFHHRYFDSVCGYTQEEMYRMSYRKETNDWTNYTELIEMTRECQSGDISYDIEERGGWTQSNPNAVNFWDKFDVNMMIYHTVLTGMMGSWNELYANYYLYKRTLNDGKWHMMVNFIEIS